jgi:uncharacterized protein YcbK (DUF882 family)
MSEEPKQTTLGRGAPWNDAGRRARGSAFIRICVHLCSSVVPFFLFLAVLAAAYPETALAGQSRFFFSGDGRIELEHAHFDEKLAVCYRDAAGVYDPEALAAVARFFRSRESGESGEISLRLIELIDYVQDRFRPRRTVLVSGYRSPTFNQALRDGGAGVAESSLHTEGIAADLQFEGINLKKLWVQLRESKTGGAGYYAEQKFLHLDTGRPRFWEPQTSGVGERLSAGNARVFARTDFDRYGTLDGAVIRLHSVTALPIRIASTARVAAGAVRLIPAGAHATVADGCIVFPESAAAYHLRIATGHAPAVKQRAPIELETCAPRVEATPEKIESNIIEILPP